MVHKYQIVEVAEVDNGYIVRYINKVGRKVTIFIRSEQVRKYTHDIYRSKYIFINNLGKGRIVVGLE